MIFDPASKDIILISFPAGGFGHFIFYILTEFANDTVKADNSLFNFSSVGDSHGVNLYSAVYNEKTDSYIPSIEIDPQDKKILILCDMGIKKENYEKINQIFTNARLIRLVIDKEVRPVINQTLIVKAMGMPSVTEESLDHIGTNWIDSQEDYAIRENFSLVYHNWNFGWLPIEGVINLSIKQLIDDPHLTLKNLIDHLGMELIDSDRFQSVVSQWYQNNFKFFKIYHKTKDIIQSIEKGQNLDITDITDLHEQGYINYCIEERYNVIIPVYDYKNWFRNTNEIVKMVKKLNVQDKISHS